MNAFARYLGAEEDWERPAPGRNGRMADLRWGLGFFVLSALGVELLRSMGAFEHVEPGIGWQYLAVVTAAGLLVWRRTHPVLVAALSAVHMTLTGIVMAPVMAGLPMQVLYFFALFSGVAWARDRRALTYVVLGIFLVMFLWLAWAYAVGSGLEELVASGFIERGAGGEGLLPPVVAGVLYIVLNNVLYFGGAVVVGQLAWRNALRSAQVGAQAGTIEQQGEQLRHQAVMAERLRIARELHDVVAHHVSVMGVQAAGARRVLDRDPQATAGALAAIEQSSRDAVGQLRDLLGTLRSDDVTEDGGSGSRAPQPTLADLPHLVAQASTPACRVHYELVEDPPGAAAAVPPPVQLSAYRVVQESLSNVRRHSSATEAHVAVRVDDHVEVEVTDNGRPRSGTSGSGLGQRGIRERAQHLGGSAEIGPRHGQGYRVRVRFPVQGVEAGHERLAGAAW